MAWYKTGTITVTNGSTTVTGSGTSWISNAAIGEALYAPDGKLYEITNIASDTTMTIAPAYLGATASAQAYVIVPSQSYIRDLAAQAADLVNNYSTIANNAGVGKFGDGTLGAPGIRFSDDLDTGFYRSASNEVTFVAGGAAIFKYNLTGGLQLSSVNLDGGTIDNTAIGGTTPAAGAFTTLSSTGATTLGDASADAITINGTPTLAVNPTLSAGTANGVAYLNGSKILTTGSALTFDGTTLTINGSIALTTVQGLFRKADPTIVAFTKTGAGTATTSTTIYVEVNGVTKTVASGTSITMPTFASGTDYAIWAKPDGTLEATSNHTSPPVANARKVGGFHYAPGGNATAQSGGNTTPQINEFSFWDLKWRPACSDPRGMTLVAGGFWVDIYLTGVDAITNGSSKYNVTMADGSSPPKVPTMFGGNGSTTYGSYTWFEAQELATAFGKRTLTQMEFMAAMYGTTEASSVGSDQVSTILNAAYTSKWGVIQATGVLWVWGRDRGGPSASAAWNANTEGRGSEYNAPNAALFGGLWVIGSVSGSRCSDWSNAASASFDSVGSRFACDHLQLD